VEPKEAQVPKKSKVKFISMAELSCNRIMAFLFEEVPGSKDRLMDILQKGAPDPTSGRCKGKHHPACTSTYGCIGERRLLFPTPFHTWMAECQKYTGVEIAEENGSYVFEDKSAVNKILS